MTRLCNNDVAAGTTPPGSLRPETLQEDLTRYQLAYRHCRDALAMLPCTNPAGDCEELDAAGEIKDPEDWCVRCAALGNANDLMIARVSRGE